MLVTFRLEKMRSPLLLKISSRMYPSRERPAERKVRFAHETGKRGFPIVIPDAAEGASRNPWTPGLRFHSALGDDITVIPDATMPRAGIQGELTGCGTKRPGTRDTGLNIT